LAAVRHTSIAPNINVVVQGSPGASPEDHQRMGAEIAKAAGEHLQAMIAKEILTQRHPGGALRR
jgi:hypothetical protein